MTFIDTHTHLYDEAFDIDRNEVIQRALDAGVKQFYLPAIDSRTHKKMINLKKLHPDYFHIMMGIHPMSVERSSLDYELFLVEKYIKEEACIAIGEIGIDLHITKAHLNEQKEAFIAQIQLAKKHKLPIVIHAREAFNEIFDILDQEMTNDLKGVFHCFSGTLSQAKKIIDYGTMKLGIGGIVTFKNGAIDTFLNEIPLEYILLETDSPYLSPAPYRGKRNEPSYLNLIINTLSRIYLTSNEIIGEVTTKNAFEVFGKQSI